MRYGEAVDRAVGIWRHIHVGDEVARQNPPAGLGQRHDLFLDDRGDPFFDQRERRVHAKQRAAEGEAVVAQLRHDPPPRWSRMKSATAAASATGNSGIGAAIGSSEAIATISGSSG